MAKVPVEFTPPELEALIQVLRVVYEDEDVLGGVFPGSKERGLAKDAFDKLKHARRGGRGVPDS